jgi:CRISPR-associated protein Csx17
MTWHLHRLDGCTPAPLAHYLKALGILRLVCEQADPHARGFWRGEQFCLLSKLSRDELVDFFLYRYAPTPLVSPWNKGSGFYQANDSGLDPIRRSTAPRFETFRVAITQVDAMFSHIQRADAAVRAIKDETKAKQLSTSQRNEIRNSKVYKQRLSAAEKQFKTLKEDLIANARKQWRGQHQLWFQSAVVLDAENAPQYPALLGTGGNDGRLDFTNNFMQCLQELFEIGASEGKPQEESSAWLSAAVFGTLANGYLAKVPIGQFLPGGAGGSNSTVGADGASIVNPWDFVLAFEGTVLFRANATKSLSGSSRAPAPFAQPMHSADFASSSSNEDSARGEQWMPLFDQPLTLRELQQIIGEGRVQSGRASAESPLDFARAIARFGTSRGISSFQRFGYIERNGQANLAVPLGRFVVPKRDRSEIRALDDLQALLRRLQRVATDTHAGARLCNSAKLVGDASFSVVGKPEDPKRWCALLEVLAELEAVQCAGASFSAGPIPPLSPAWVNQAHDGSAEFRLALALANAGNKQNEKRVAGVRAHFAPINGLRFDTIGTIDQQRLRKGPELVVQHRDAELDCINILQRRMIDRSGSGGSLPLHGFSYFANSSDLALMLDGAIDLARTMRLARALCALKNPTSLRVPTVRRDARPDGAWMVLRLALYPDELPILRTKVSLDSALLRLLAAGDVERAFAIALRVLRIAGVRPVVRCAYATSEQARRWAAALVFPIGMQTAQYFLETIDPPLAERHSAA